jgi:hypothetical protein
MKAAKESVERVATLAGELRRAIDEA